MTAQGEHPAPQLAPPVPPAAGTMPNSGAPRLGSILASLRDTLADVRYPLRLPDAAEAAKLARATLGQLDDYLIPRLGRLDAPLLVVVGGSTGAGKSTLVNSLVRATVSPAGARRPTTRAPVLVCHPDDAAWFTEAHLLPHLSRTHTAGTGGDDLRIVPVPALTAGLALLDAPDIDSVVESNRELAERLLAAADRVAVRHHRHPVRRCRPLGAAPGRP
jgi:hypothetical protein